MYTALDPPAFPSAGAVLHAASLGLDDAEDTEGGAEGGAPGRDWATRALEWYLKGVLGAKARPETGVVSLFTDVVRCAGGQCRGACWQQGRSMSGAQSHAPNPTNTTHRVFRAWPAGLRLRRSWRSKSFPLVSLLIYFRVTVSCEPGPPLPIPPIDPL